MKKAFYMIILAALILGVILSACTSPNQKDLPRLESGDIENPEDSIKPDETPEVSQANVGERSLMDEIRHRLCTTAFLGQPLGGNLEETFYDGTDWMEKLVVVQVKEGGTITVQPGVSLITAKPLLFLAMAEEDGYWLINKSHAQIGVDIHDRVVRTQPDNISPDTEYTTSERETFSIGPYWSKRFSELQVEADTTVYFDITNVKDKIGYLCPAAWRTPGVPHYFAAEDEVEQVLPVNDDYLVYVPDEEVSAEAADCVYADAQSLRARFLLLAGDPSSQKVCVVDALLEDPVFVDRDACVLFDSEETLLSADIPQGEYLLLLGWSFDSSQPPESMLGLYRLTQSEEDENQLVLRWKAFDSDFIREHKGYYRID